MTHRKLEQMLDLLINEETDAASELLHTVLVEKARTLYEDLVDEDFGGDAKEDFADEIEANKDEIESDEIYDDDDESKGEDEEMDMEGDAEGDVEDDAEGEEASEEEVDDRLEDVEAGLAELRAEFDALMAEEEGEEAHIDMEGDAEGEVDMDIEGDMEGEVDMEYAEEGRRDNDESMYEEIIDELGEATKLQDEVPDTGQKQEGKHVGTGKESKIGKTGKESQFTKAPRKADHGGKPHATGVGGDESTKKVSQGKDNTPSSNIDAKEANQSAADKNVPGDDKGAGSTLGGKGSPKGV